MVTRLKLLALGIAIGATPPVFADFSTSIDFLAAEPRRTDALPGWDLPRVQGLSPKTVNELIATVAGRPGRTEFKRPQRSPERPQPKAAGPVAIVQSPQTKEKPVVVPLMRETEDPAAEILAEAARLLDIELPPAPVHVRPVRPVPSAPLGPVPENPASSLEGMQGITPHALDLAATETAASFELRIGERDGKLLVRPETVTLRVEGPAAQVVFDGLRLAPQLFIRDRQTVSWDVAQKKLHALAPGRSELYVTYGDQLLILPIEVQSRDQRPPLAGPQQQALQRLTSILPQSPSFASFGIRDEAALPTTRESPEDLSLAQAAAAVDLTQARRLDQQARFVFPEPSPDYRTFAVQVLDERSAPESGLVYPVSGMKVQLIGSRIQAETDARGQALFGEIPDGARFWVLLEDDKGHYVPTVSELSLPRGGKGQVLRARTMSYRSYFAYQNVLNLAQDTNLGSFCGRAMQDDGKQPLAGLRVDINVEADGPFYFSSFGPQRELDSTDASGRFCFFNVKPGLVELVFHAGREYRTAVALPVFPGAHSEEDLLLANAHGRRVFLAAIPSAMEQIYEDGGSRPEFQPVDGIDLLSIGDNEPMERLSPGVLGQEAGASSFKGRVYALAQAPEFENVLYSLDKDKEWRQHLPVIPLIQRGFVEDLYQELNLQEGRESRPFDPAMGQALIFHRLEEGQSQVRISLIDTAGRVLDEGWYFGNPTLGSTRAVFFNLQPGLYQVRVESPQGALISMDTFAVDYWTTALVQTGSSLHYSLLDASRASAEAD